MLASAKIRNSFSESKRNFDRNRVVGGLEGGGNDEKITILKYFSVMGNTYK